MIKLLDCTLRDGAYINNANFGFETIRGIIKRMQDAKVEIIECGWLKNEPHKKGTTYFHDPNDLKEYLVNKDPNVTYVTMIDWDRYNLDYLPEYDGQSVDAIRVVFPRGKAKEGLNIASKIRDKGYRIFCQAANTLGYSNKELLELIDEVNRVKPESISIVDTFGAMYPDDLDRILPIFVHNLHPSIKIGFHSHNNQQLSFALTIQFVKYLLEQGRQIIVDSSLCGMGRGAGNATTELVTSFLNKKYYGNYDLDMIMDTIDMYMVPFQEKFSWGYSIPTYIAGMYCSHVNNIDYLLKKHRATAKEIRCVISSLKSEERVHYDYSLLEQRYIENQNNEIDDKKTLEILSSQLSGKEILLIAPGNSSIEEKEKIEKFIQEHNPIVIGVNAVLPSYKYDYLYLMNQVRYDYAKEAYPKQFNNIPKILLSCIKSNMKTDVYTVRYERAIKRGWEHFDNAVICLLRLLNKLNVKKVAVAGFDEFSSKYNESYADPKLPTVHGIDDWDKFNEELKEMFNDLLMRVNGDMEISMLTDTNLVNN